MYASPSRAVSIAAMIVGLGAVPAWAQEIPAPVQAAEPVAVPEQPEIDPASAAAEESAPTTDILSGRTLSVLLDARIVAANGERSFLDRGMGKTRFSGAADGDFRIEPIPVEADLIWTPRFTGSLAGNVSASWQRDQEHEVDLLEAFVTFNPSRGEHFSFSAKAGLYWPEISLEHATGGAWSTVHTITPSAINSWAGEEVKVVGVEATVTATLGQHDVLATGGAFGFNDTSGTLLSFRGWGLHDLKATGFGHIQLPVLNTFMTRAQAPTTLSLLEIDNKVGFYGRLEWRPPAPFSINAFYYDNRGDPHIFNPSLQWGWRTRFANVGLSAQLAPGTQLLAQAMYGTTQMGIIPRDATTYWVDTKYRSAYVLVAQDLGGNVEITGRAELFDTKERGSRMDPTESENGGAGTIAGRWIIDSRLTGFVELMHVRSHRGVRVRTGEDPFQAQTVIQASLRLRI